MHGRNRRHAWLLGAAGLAGVLWLGGRVFSGGEPDEAARTDRLVNQAWIERMPKDQRDQVGFLHAVEHDGKRIGGVGRGSAWRVHVDLFRWALEGDRFRATFPQDHARVQGKVRTWRCAGEAPRPFDLCLEVRTEKRTLRFFSKDSWKIRPHDGALDAAAAAELPWLAPALLGAAKGDAAEQPFNEEGGTVLDDFPVPLED